MKAQDIVTHLTGNAAFTTPNPTLASVQTHIDTANTKFSAAVAAVTAARMAIQEKRAALLVVENDIQLLALYVGNVADGDEAKILSAGFDVRAPATPVGIPDAPIGLSTNPGNFPGQLTASWGGVAGAVIYEIQTSNDPNVTTSWATRGTSTRTNTVVENLPTGGQCWVRVRAISSAGPGPYSDPAVKTVP